MPGDASLRVLIVGGGVAGLEALVALRTLAGERVQVELLSDDATFANRPASVAVPFGVGPPRPLDVAAVAAAHGAAFRRGRLQEVDVPGHEAVTQEGDRIAYDALVVAVGGHPKAVVRGALTFRGGADAPRFRELLRDLHLGRFRKLAFALPAGVSWALPLYELALMTATRARALGVRDVELVLTTPEERPLGLFGARASDAIAELLGEAGVSVITGVYPTAVSDGQLVLTPDGRVPADRVVSLPQLRGPRIAGLPQDSSGFLETDPHGRVLRAPDVYAAGDASAFAVKQGGIAAQQADAVAETLAARAGADVDPRPFRPVLRGLLLTGRARQFLRATIAGGAGETSEVASMPLWWPPTKVAARYFGAYMARATGQLPTAAPDDPSAISITADVA